MSCPLLQNVKFNSDTSIFSFYNKLSLPPQIPTATTCTDIFLHFRFRSDKSKRKLFILFQPSKQQNFSVCGKSARKKSEIHGIWFLLMGF